MPSFDLRGFSTGFRSGVAAYDSAADEKIANEKLQLSKNADARAQRSSDRADQERADEQAALDALYGVPSVAAKATSPAGGAAAGRGLPDPMRVGGPPPAARTPQEDEDIETLGAEARGVRVAPPAAIRSPARKETSDEAPPATRGGLPSADEYASRLRAQGVRITPKVAAIIEKRRQEEVDAADKAEQRRIQREQLDVQRGQLKVSEGNLKLNQNKDERDAAKHLLTMDEEKYNFTMKKLKDVNNTITAQTQDLDGLDDGVSVFDPKVEAKVATLADNLKRFHAETPDGKRAEVTRTDQGYKVQEFDEKTGEAVGPAQMISNLGQVRAFARIPGVMTQGDNFGKYTAGTLADRTVAATMKNDKISEDAKLRAKELVPQFLDSEKLADPNYVKQMVLEARKLEGLIGKEGMITVDVPYTDPETGKTVVLKQRVNPYEQMIKLATPSQTVERAVGGKPQKVSAEQFVQEQLAQLPALQKKGMSAEQIVATTAAAMKKLGFPDETIKYHVGQMSQKIGPAIQQGLAAAARPKTDSEVPPAVGLPRRPVDIDRLAGPLPPR